MEMTTKQELLEEQISKWISEQVEKAGAHGVVVGLSGGIDSSVTAVLAKKAVANNSLGLIMPCQSSKEDEKFANLLAEKIDLRTEKVDLNPVFDKFLEVLPPACRGAKSNLKPRVRMATLYYFAAKFNYLVAGTGNKSEIITGYFTKYGDSGADILPLGDLLKSDVKKLAKSLHIPEEIIDREPTAGLWEGQTDEKELGLTYRELDEAIEAIKLQKAELLVPEVFWRISELIDRSKHKRQPIPIFKKNRLDVSKQKEN